MGNAQRSTKLWVRRRRTRTSRIDVLVLVLCAVVVCIDGIVGEDGPFKRNCAADDAAGRNVVDGKKNG